MPDRIRRAPTTRAPASGRPPTRRALLASAVAALAFLSCTLAGASAAPVGESGVAAERVRLVFLHTNDVHGQVLPLGPSPMRPDGPRRGGLPALARWVAALRAEVAAEADGVLVVDAGDWFQGTPEGGVGGGRGFVGAMAAVGYDAMALGNHELDLGLEHLQELLGDADPPAICANLRDPATGARVPWVEPWRVVRAGGLEIALVGLLTPETPVITHEDARALEFRDPVRALAEALLELGDRVDLVVPVTHLGLEGDRRLAEAFPELPLVVGGHSHTFLSEGARVGDVLVVQAGSKARTLGRADLVLERGRDGWTAVESSARLVDLDVDRHLDRSVRAVEEACARLVAAGEASLSRVVGRLAAPLARGEGAVSSSAGNWVTDAMRRASGADVAIQNRGGIRSEVAAGDVRRRDLYELLPFGNTLVTVELSGAALVESVRRGVETKGKGGIEFSGMRARVRRGPDGALRLVGVEVADRPVDPDARYLLATNSFLARGGDGYLALGDDPEVADSGRVLRELLEAELASGTIDPPVGNRYVEEAP